VSEGIEIRAAEPADAERLLEMYEWLFAPPGGPPPGWQPQAARGRLLETIDSADAVVLLASASEVAAAGFCSAYIDLRSVRFGTRCWVEDLAVDPGCRSRGVGAALLAAARGWARERGATHLELDSGEARTDAHRFYEREGPAWRSLQFTWWLAE
jgi:GNAT superfamily N-acetyltransferase